MPRVASLFAVPLVSVLLAGLLTSCSSDAELPQVSGQYGDKPKITVAKDTSPSDSLDYQVLAQGDGPKVGKGDLLVADYLGENYRSHKVFDNSYDRKTPTAFPIGVGKVIKGWDKSLVGVKAGSRVLMVVPPQDGYRKKGNEKAGIKGTDSLIFVVDVIASYPKKGAAQKNSPATDVPADLPQVSGKAGQEPTIAVPAGTTPPSKPGVTVLAKGTGPAAAKGKLVVVQYAAMSWAGKPLASSWATGPVGVPIGGPQPSPFDLLDGVPEGSRVLLTLPAQTGTPADQESVAVVIDVLGVHGPAKQAA